MTETQFQIQAMKYLRQRGHLAIHVPNEGYRTKREGAIAKKKGVLPGVSDILVLDLGCAIELKTENGVVSRSQDLFLRAVRSVGWTAGVARSMADVEELIERAKNAIE